MPVLVLEKRPLQHFSKSLARLKYIQFIQNDIENLDTAKKQTKIWYLNQSYLLHVVALWELFIESQVTYTFTKMTKINPVGIFENILKTKVKDSIERFHTPNLKNIDRLFKEVIGIEHISNAWTWENMPIEKSKDLLFKILETRHEIAHQSRTQNSELSFVKNFEYMKHLYNLAYLIDFSVNKHLATLTGEKFEHQIVIPHPQE